MFRFCMGVCALGIAVVFSSHAAAELQFDEGHWRLELSAGLGIHSGSQDRTGDVLVTGTVEYEFPATQRTTLGLRLLPLLVYVQDDSNRRDWLDWEEWDEPRIGDGDTVFGAGAGLSYRIYTQKQTYRGLFFEVSGVALGHVNKINGNDSNFNFLTGGGVGYKFKNDFHTILKYEHISSAGIGSPNRGVNTVGLGFGYSF